MKTLMEIYAPLFEAGPSGREVRWSEIDGRWPGASVAWDRDRAESAATVRFTDDGGKLRARVGRNTRLAWDPEGEAWRSDVPVGRAAVSSDDRGGRYHDILTSRATAAPNSERAFNDVASRLVTDYVGNGWANMIDSAYGPGSSKRLLRDLWQNNWTDHEAANEVLHFYDVAQQYTAELAQRRSWPEGPGDIEVMRANSLGLYPLRVHRAVDPDTDEFRTERPGPARWIDSPVNAARVDDDDGTDADVDSYEPTDR